MNTDNKYKVNRLYVFITICVLFNYVTRAKTIITDTKHSCTALYNTIIQLYKQQLQSQQQQLQSQLSREENVDLEFKALERGTNRRQRQQRLCQQNERGRGGNTREIDHEIYVSHPRFIESSAVVLIKHFAVISYVSQENKANWKEYSDDQLNQRQRQRQAFLGDKAVATEETVLRNRCQELFIEKLDSMGEQEDTGKLWSVIRSGVADFLASVPSMSDFEETNVIISFFEAFCHLLSSDDKVLERVADEAEQMKAINGSSSRGTRVWLHKTEEEASSSFSPCFVHAVLYESYRLALLRTRRAAPRRVQCLISVSEDVLPGNMVVAANTAVLWNRYAWVAESGFFRTSELTSLESWFHLPLARLEKRFFFNSIQEDLEGIRLLKPLLEVLLFIILPEINEARSGEQSRAREAIQRRATVEEQRNGSMNGFHCINSVDGREKAALVASQDACSESTELNSSETRRLPVSPAIEKRTIVVFQEVEPSKAKTSTEPPLDPEVEQDDGVKLRTYEKYLRVLCFFGFCALGVITFETIALTGGLLPMSPMATIEKELAKQQMELLLLHERLQAKELTSKLLRKTIMQSSNDDELSVLSQSLEEKLAVIRDELRELGARNANASEFSMQEEELQVDAVQDASICSPIKLVAQEEVDEPMAMKEEPVAPNVVASQRQWRSRRKGMALLSASSSRLFLSDELCTTIWTEASQLLSGNAVLMCNLLDARNLFQGDESLALHKPRRNRIYPSLLFTEESAPMIPFKKVQKLYDSKDQLRFIADDKSSEEDRLYAVAPFKGTGLLQLTSASKRRELVEHHSEASKGLVAFELNAHPLLFGGRTVRPRLYLKLSCMLNEMNCVNQPRVEYLAAMAVVSTHQFIPFDERELLHDLSKKERRAVFFSELETGTGRPQPLQSLRNGLNIDVSGADLSWIESKMKYLSREVVEKSFSVVDDQRESFSSRQSSVDETRGEVFQVVCVDFDFDIRDSRNSSAIELVNKLVVVSLSFDCALTRSVIEEVLGQLED